MGCKIALIAVTLFLVLSFMPGYAEAACNNPYSGSGNWLISGSVVCNNTKVTISGNLTIESTGSLDLDNVTIEFDYSSPGGIGIGNLGSLTAVSSTFRSYGTNNYFFFSGNGSSIDISDSVLKNIGISTSVAYKSGLYLATDSASFTGNNFSVFTKIISFADGISIEGNDFTDGCFILNGSGNTVSDNVISDVTPCSIIGDQNTISGNTITGGSGGMLVDGDGNTIEGMTVSDVTTCCGNPLPFVVKGDNNTVTGLVSTDNTVGISMAMATNSVIKDSEFQNNGIDIETVSSAVTLTNTNYTTMKKKWYLTVQVEDSDGVGISSADVEVFDNIGDNYFDSTGYDGMTGGIEVTEQFENKSRANSSIAYGNPHTVTVTKGSYASYENTLNITGDTLLEVTLLDFSSMTPFILIIESPENRTYMMGDPDIESGDRIKVLVTSGANMSSCSFVIGGQSGSMSRVTDMSFQGYFNLTGLEGVKRITVNCESSDYRTNSSSLDLTLFADYECFSDQQCQFDETCESNVCEQLVCDCGYASDHECTYYDCCSNDDCRADEYCDAAPHVCKEVQCSCGFIQDHKCERPDDYCCVDAHCNSNQTCNVETHACITRTLTLYVSGSPVLGRTIKVYVRDHNNDTVKDVRLTLRYDETGTTESYFTNETSQSGYYAEIPIDESGPFSITARRVGYFSDKEDMTAQQDILMLLVYVVIIFVAVIGIVFLVFKLKKPSSKSPLKLDKEISGQNVILKVKNKKKDVLENIEVIDHVPLNSFISSSVMPEIIPKQDMTDELVWSILRLEPKEEVDISYMTSGVIKGFKVRVGGEEYAEK
ncbi:MAG: hypothetical protein JW754_00845 [Candidatus Aenigmarchaeota archaeon]|nr:hypothetical protein [Candidatus Aenigmarchaeota archaeon]